jgi:four helix bundle protein
MWRADRVRMPTIKHHKDLLAWQLASELKRRVFQIVARPSVARHFNFCDQIRRSSRSGPANLAEGFWRYRPRENAKFVRVALGSLGETVNHLFDAFTEKYIEEDEYRELEALGEQALRTTAAWHNYLENCADLPPAAAHKPKSPGPKKSRKKWIGGNDEISGSLESQPGTNQKQEQTKKTRTN